MLGTHFFYQRQTDGHSTGRAWGECFTLAFFSKFHLKITVSFGFSRISKIIFILITPLVAYW